MIDIRLNDYLERLRGAEKSNPAAERRQVPTYVELAKESGISPVTLSRITNGHTKQLNVSVLASLVTSLRRRGFATEIGDLLVYHAASADGEQHARESMKPFRTVSNLELKLEQPSARKQLYELREEGALVGTLFWPKMFSSNCLAEAADGTWDFTRHGFFNTRVVARASATEQEVLVYTPNWTGIMGKMQHRDGREFELKGANWWGNGFALVQKTPQQVDVELLSVAINFRLFRGSANVVVQPQLPQMQDASLLALFACYLAAMAVEDQSSGMA